MTEAHGGIMPPIEQEFMRAFIAARKWRLAKDRLHSYTVREWSINNIDFDEFVILLRQYGHPENFYNSTYIYWALGDKKYWTMGDTLSGTIIINMAPVDQFMGRQLVDYGNNPDLYLKTDWRTR
jgi:hypothetical protein